MDGLNWLENFLASFRGGMIVVSHDRRFLDNTIHRIIELDGISPEVNLFEGGYTDYREEKRLRFARWQADFEAQEEYRRRLEADIERTRQQALSVEQSTRNDRARRYAKKVARKAKARERRLTRQTEAPDWLAAPRQPDRIALTTSAVSEAGRLLLRLSDIEVALDDRIVLRGIDLALRGRERLAVIGRNGAGKTTLLRVMSGELAPSSGRVEAAATIAVLPQDHSRLPLEETVLRSFRANVVGHEDEARTFLARFLFPAALLGRSLGRLSPGERARLLIAVMVASRAQLLLLDEPTNHLDFASLDVIEEALFAFEGTVVVVSHDRAFVENIGCDRVVEVYEQRIVERSLSCITGDALTTEAGAREPGRARRAVELSERRSPHPPGWQPR